MLSSLLEGNIIGIDLLYNCQLLIDVYNFRLIDDKTKLTINRNFGNSLRSALSSIPPTKNAFDAILNDLPKLHAAIETRYTTVQMPQPISHGLRCLDRIWS